MLKIVLRIRRKRRLLEWVIFVVFFCTCNFYRLSKQHSTCGKGCFKKKTQKPHANTIMGNFCLFIFCH